MRRSRTILQQGSDKYVSLFSPQTDVQIVMLQFCQTGYKVAPRQQLLDLAFIFFSW